MIPSKNTLQAIKAMIANKYPGQSATDVLAAMNAQKSQSPPVFTPAPLSKASFMLLIAPAVLAVGSKPDLVAKWGPTIALLQSAPDSSVVDVTSPIMIEIFAQLVSDSLMSQATIDVVVASGRIEVLQSDASSFGYSSLTIDDINAAMNA